MGNGELLASTLRNHRARAMETAVVREDRAQSEMTWGIAPSDVTECAKSSTNLGTGAAAEGGSSVPRKSARWSKRRSRGEGLSRSACVNASGESQGKAVLGSFGGTGGADRHDDERADGFLTRS